MTVSQLLSLCWDYEFVSLEIAEADGTPWRNSIPMEAGQVLNCFPEAAEKFIHQLYIGIRYVPELWKSVATLVVTIAE